MENILHAFGGNKLRRGLQKFIACFTIFLLIFYYYTRTYETYRRPLGSPYLTRLSLALSEFALALTHSTENYEQRKR